MTARTPCPGVPWDVRPSVLIRPCRDCARPIDPDAAIKAPAYRKDGRWVCDEQISLDSSLGLTPVPPAPAGGFFVSHELPHERAVNGQPTD